MSADAVLSVEAKITDDITLALKSIQGEMKRLEHTSYEAFRKMEKHQADLDKKANGTAKAFMEAQKSVLKWAGGITAGVLSVRALSSVISDSIGEAQAAREAQKDLAATLASTGHAAGVTQRELNAMADSLSVVTNFEDDAITKSQAMLLTFTKIGKDVFPEATEATLNMAQKFKTDASQAAIQLGKALNDPIQGITALRRVGVAFTEQQEAQIKAMVKSGNILGAQRTILAELTTEFGGLARASADPMKQFQNRLSNVKEDIGNALLPALDSAAIAIGKLIDEGNKTGQLQSAFSVIGDAADLAAGAISGVVKAMAVLNQMEGRSGGTGIGDVEGAKALKKSLEDVKRLKLEILKPEAQTTMVNNELGQRVKQSDDLARQLTAAKANVEKVAGTVAAPGILQDLDKNIRALELRITKLQRPGAAPTGGPAKAAGAAATVLTDAEKKAIDERVNAEIEGEIKVADMKRKTQEEGKKYREDLLVKVREAHEMEAKEARQASRILAEAQAGTDEMALLKVKQETELAAYADNEKAITDLKAAHGLQRVALQKELDEQALQSSQKTNDAIVSNYLGMGRAISQVLGVFAGKSKTAFLAQQAFAAAEIAVNTARAYVAALAPPPLGLGPVLGIPLANSILGLGLAQGAVVAGTTVSKFASGTLAAPGGMAWVGERGPELIPLERGTRVYNNSESMAMAGKSGTTQIDVGGININLSGAATRADAQMIGDEVDRRLRGLAKDMKEIEYRGIRA